ncbi:hypothetical protein Q0Z83_049120 [Actinoplanes sichuanensis]|nr:hypothetical protein Q0Z83_049120 [Actinoplanes sichuanensis]
MAVAPEEAQKHIADVTIILSHDKQCHGALPWDLPCAESADPASHAGSTASLDRLAPFAAEQRRRAEP